MGKPEDPADHLCAAKTYRIDPQTLHIALVINVYAQVLKERQAQLD